MSEYIKCISYNDRETIHYDNNKKELQGEIDIFSRYKNKFLGKYFYKDRVKVKEKIFLTSYLSI